MESVLLVLAVAFLFGGMLLMLVMGYGSSERERARRASAREAEAARRAAAIITVPSFFARSDGTVTPLNVVFDDALVGRLEQHVRLEQALVAPFVHHPSIDNLYRQPGTPTHVH